MLQLFLLKLYLFINNLNELFISGILLTALHIIYYLSPIYFEKVKKRNWFYL